MSRWPAPPIERAAALRLSQEIGTAPTAAALGLPRKRIDYWREQDGAIPLPRGYVAKRLGKPECYWCGEVLSAPGLCPPPATCRAEYIADAVSAQPTEGESTDGR